MQDENVDYDENMTKVRLDLRDLSPGIMELAKKACTNAGKRASSPMGKARVIKPRVGEKPTACRVEAMVRVAP
jgi:hypothetical protein